MCAAIWAISRSQLSPNLHAEPDRQRLWVNAGTIRGVLSIREYLEFVDANPDTLLLSSELHTPSEILELFQMPDYCLLQGLPDDAKSMMFLGNAGNYGTCTLTGIIGRSCSFRSSAQSASS